jgi:hypothetical protein
MTNRILSRRKFLLLAATGAGAFALGLAGCQSSSRIQHGQLLAQQLRPDSFVCVAGYGECAPGYIPIERAWVEDDTNLHDWCWVAPGAEQRMTTALEAALKKSPNGGR